MKDIKDNINKYIDKNWISKNFRKIVIAFVVGGAALGITAGAMDIYAKNMEVDILQGIVYAKDVSINTKIPGRIVKFYVEEGQKVKAGDKIVEISSEELEAKKLQLVAQVNQAQAGVDASQAVVEMAQANYNLAEDRVNQAQAGVKASQSQRDIAVAISKKAANGARAQELAQAQSAYTLWESTYNRASVLYEGGAITKQKLEEIKTQMEVSKQTLSMAEEGARSEDKEAADAQVSMAEAGVLASSSVLAQANEGLNAALAQVNQAQAGLVAAREKLEQAKAGLQEVEVYLNDTIIKSPIDGTVTSINSDEGELVSTGTSIGTISNLESCWVNVNLGEDRLMGLQEGQTVEVKFASFKDKSYEGTISTINKEPDFAVKKATNENGNFDIVSYAVKIKLNNLDQSIRPGMTAFVNFKN